MNKEIEMLNKKIDAQDKIINTQALEIARLNKDLKDACLVIKKLKKEKEKAIEWVHKHISKYNCKGITIIDWDILSNPNNLLEILGDKE